MTAASNGRRAAVAIALFVLSSCVQDRGSASAVAVREAVFKQQVGYWLADHARESGLVICLQVGRTEATAVASQLEPRDRDAVRSADQCVRQPSGAIERSTSRPAIILSVTSITWPTADEAVVEVEHFRSSIVSGRRRYRVIREQREWVCLGQTVDITPV
jgi:hypothetical protein